MNIINVLSNFIIDIDLTKVSQFNIPHDEGSILGSGQGPPDESYPDYRPL